MSITFAITTPSYNQASFISETIESVIGQAGDFSIDYFIADGGSDDGTIDVIREYERELKSGGFRTRCRDVRFRWVSEKDGGQYDAVNKGFAQVNGEVMAYINSDDKYAPGAFAVVERVLRVLPDVRWLVSAWPLFFNQDGQTVGVDPRPGYGRESFLRGVNVPGEQWFSRYFIPQDCVFWRRDLWREAGGEIKTEHDLAADFELWMRFFSGAQLYAVESTLAGFRFQPNQRSGDQQAYNREALEILIAAGGRPRGRLASIARGRLIPLLRAFPYMGRVLRAFGLLEETPAVEWSHESNEWTTASRWLS